jgi:hypothetical protein
MTSVHVFDEVGYGYRGFVCIELQHDVAVVGRQFDLGHKQFALVGNSCSATVLQ